MTAELLHDDIAGRGIAQQVADAVVAALESPVALAPALSVG